MKLTALIATGVTAFILTGCGTSPEGQEGEEAQQTEQASAAPSETAPVTDDYTDALGIQRAKIDPASVKVTRCRATKDDYTSIGEGISYGAESAFRVTNTTTLTGTVSLTVQYQNANGDAVAESPPGVNNIRPGQSAKITDSTGVEKGDLPGDVVKCVVVKAEVYVPTE
ncbi:hypothetical protein AB0J28_07130 [Streptosporangium canum]|uniref:hypothetical protein n=1 Tax=Streptosporangium canum TaxID=324952 RepID=UPI0034421EE6